MIIGGFIGSCLWSEIAIELGHTRLVAVLPGMVAVLGGFYTFRRERWGWALTGAICSLTFPILGIPALILLLKRKTEFD